MENIPSVMPEFGEELLFPGIAGVFYLIYMLIMFAVSAGTYIFESLGFYSIAKRRGIKKPWLAWIPVGNLWILGSISDQYQYVVKGRIKNKRKVLLTLSILLYVAVLAVLVIAVAMIAMGLGGPPQPNNELTDVASMLVLLIILIIMWVVMAGASIAATVIMYIALYDLYSSCDPKNNVLYLLLNIFVNITLPIFLFICRDKDLGMPPRRPESASFIPQAPVVPVREPWENPPEE